MKLSSQHRPVLTVFGAKQKGTEKIGPALRFLEFAAEARESAAARTFLRHHELWADCSKAMLRLRRFLALQGRDLLLQAWPSSQR